MKQAGIGAAEEKPREASAPVKRRGGKARAERRMADFDGADFSEGSTVRHTVFGEGVIREKKGDRLVIDFEHYGRKKMLISYCLANGLLSPSDGSGVDIGN